jgi:Cu2+-exporting ATPase
MQPGSDTRDSPGSAASCAPGDPCFHCGEPLPERPFFAEVGGIRQPMCCRGCQAVAQLIADSRLDEFYRFREGPGPRPEDEELEQRWTAYDRPRIRESFVITLPGGDEEAAILVEGIRCAACSWLIERTLMGGKGIHSAQLNPSTGRGMVRYDPATASPGRIFANIARLGYRPHPAGSGEWEQAQRGERHRALRRLAVAGLGMMQVMTFAVSLYAGAFQGMDPWIREFLRLVSLLVATPVAFYAGGPFFRGAIRDIRARSPGMDVPVSLAIGVAYSASVWNSLRGVGEVYFDSVTMFVFFLSLGRYLEMMARHRAGNTADALSLIVPRTALRIIDGDSERVGVNELSNGDIVLVRPGDSFPCDGTITDGCSDVDESLISGESRLLGRGPMDEVLGGSTNVTNPVRVRVDATGSDTVVAGITRLLERAQAERPGLARLANRVASWFVAAVLVVASLVAAYWFIHDPTHALPITLSVLVITCPCALSLATPVALTAATSHLARHGVLVTRARAVEAMSRCNRVIFDKTGTLTYGRLRIDQVHSRPGVNTADALAIAAALERECGHPIASAFAGIAITHEAEKPNIVTGRGIEGSICGKKYRLGHPDFVAELATGSRELAWCPGPGGIVLGDEQGAMAEIILKDAIRPEALQVIRSLQTMGLAVELATGDRKGAAMGLADKLGISQVHANLAPEDKLSLLRQRQQQGDRVMMVGDGINDAPVLAGADVSVALGSGAALAQSTADSILLGNSLMPLLLALSTASGTLKIIRQNLAWALAYNAGALPLAAAGLVQPWMAAIGMSASSLLVVLNALRVNRISGHGSVPSDRAPV